MSAGNAAPAVVNEIPTESVPKVFYKIESNNNVIVEMSSEAIKQSKTLTDLVSSRGVTNDSIPVKNINGATLKLVAKWCEKHKGEPNPEEDDNVLKMIKNYWRTNSEAIKQTKTLSGLVSNLGVTNNSTAFYYVNGAALKLVANWCEQLETKSMPKDDDNFLNYYYFIPDWDQYFLSIDNEQLSDLICAANYLNIKGLMNYACMKVVSMANGKSPEELRAIFGILTDKEDEAAANKDGTETA